MAKKTAFLHIDLSGLEGDVITHTLMRHRESLKELRFKVPVKRREESVLAQLEMTRTHRLHGFTRKQVEGAWSGICRHARKGKKTPLISAPAFAFADEEQVQLILEGLHGLRTQVVLTIAEGSLDSEVVRASSERWTRHAKKGTLHVVEIAAGDWGHAWEEYAGLAGFGAAQLGLATQPVAA